MLRDFLSLEGEGVYGCCGNVADREEAQAGERMLRMRFDSMIQCHTRDCSEADVVRTPPQMERGEGQRRETGRCLLAKITKKQPLSSFPVARADAGCSTVAWHLQFQVGCGSCT